MGRASDACYIIDTEARTTPAETFLKESKIEEQNACVKAMIDR
jgi:hypothetical protein